MFSSRENPLLVDRSPRNIGSNKHPTATNQLSISNINCQGIIVEKKIDFRTHEGNKLMIATKNNPRSNHDGYMEPRVLPEPRQPRRGSATMETHRRKSLPSLTGGQSSSSANNKTMSTTNLRMKTRRSSSLTCLETSTTKQHLTKDSNHSKDSNPRRRLSDGGKTSSTKSVTFPFSSTTRPVDQREVWAYASKHAFRTMKKVTSYSRLLDPKMMESLPKFKREEIVLGDLLGSGGFNDVYGVHEIKLDKRFSFDYSPQEQHARSSMALKTQPSGGKMKGKPGRELAALKGKGPYAIKFLNKKCMSHPEKFCRGAADLMIETAYLSSLYPHSNIIGLHGVAAAGHKGFSSGLEGGYFLIVDRLVETLESRIKTWKKASSSTGGEAKVTLKRRSSISDLLSGAGGAADTERPLSAQDLSEGERLRITLKVCSALAHLHKFNVIFRDLKPDNVGFDMRGNVKLFDFGLIKELENASSGRSNDLMSGGAVGSRRYMAPEVAMEKPYGLSADVYSFSILLWRVRTLEEPFDGYTRAMHYDRVVMQNERPLLDNTWSHVLSHITRCSWNPDPTSRPSSQALYLALEREVEKTIQRDYAIGKVKQRMSL